MYKNIEKEKALSLKDLVDYSEGQVVSKTLVQNELVSMTVFSFDKGEEISSHSAGGDAMVNVLEGTGEIVINDVPHVLNAGEAIVIPAGAPHSVRGVTAFKMLLVVALE